MLAQERYDRILDALQKCGNVTVKELSDNLAVSVDTIRRDLRYLEQKELLKRVHGGAVGESMASRGGVTNTTFESRVKQNIEEKREIAQKALQLVSEHQALALNAGTTNIELAKQLIEEFQFLTIFTNSLLIANLVDAAPGFTLYLAGGFLDNEEHSLYGEGISEVPKHFNCDIAFISVNALSLKRGLSDFRKGEREVINTFRSIAEKVVVLADSSKFETSSYLHVCPIDAVDLIISDSGLDESIKREYLKNDVKII